MKSFSHFLFIGEGRFFIFFYFFTIFLGILPNITFLQSITVVKKKRPSVTYIHIKKLILFSD